MTTATLEREVTAPRARKAPSPIPMSRIVGVELRKMFDTRSGFWLMTSIGIAALLATTAVILWAPEDELTFETFASAIGFPMAVILPMVAVLSVTSEWTQRSGLTTFTLVPHRGRVITAKMIGTVGIGVASMLVAFVVGAIGNVVGTTIAGVDTTWNVSAAELAMIIIANILGMMIGFMLGVLLRNSPAAIVSYFVYGFVAPTLFMVLAEAQEWFRDLQPWVDFNYSQTALFDGLPSSEQWAQIGVSGIFWLLIPLAVGLRMVLRSEVK
jgi:hypothetical protein